MANLKQYTIQINGIEQSITAVDALNKQLDALEKKIDALQGKTVNAVNAASTPSVGGGGGSRTAELSDEDKLLKQIEATQSRINQADMDDYKVLLDKKQELKELVTEQKSMTAEARLTEGAYANTMLGMKQHLADIKAAMQTVDLGDTDTFKKLTKDANELNQKLLEIEKSYGQFGRNVGNYPSAVEGFKGLKIQVGDTVAEFVNARQALKALKQEMQTLSTKKDMGIISEEEAERLKSLIPTVKQLESSIQDAGKPMDALMDNMQSFVALAQAGKGLSAFFGLEGTEIDETIKNLVALQNAMQGLQTIQKQLQTQEGLGKYFSKANTAIDNFTKKLFGVKKATKDLTTEEKKQAAATSKVASASKTAATAAGAQSAANVGLTVSSKVATVAARALGAALKAIGIGILLEGISLAIEGIKALVSWLSSTTEEEKRAQEVFEAGAKAYAEASAQIVKYTTKVDQFNGTIEQEKELVEELNKELGDELGHHQTLAEWKDILAQKGDAYCTSMLKQAEAQAILNQYTENYIKLLQAQKIAAEGGDTAEWLPWNWGGKSAQEKADEKVREIEKTGNDIIAEYKKKLQEINSLEEEYQIGDFAPKSETGSTSGGHSSKVGKTAKDIENDIINQRIKVMREGLTKTIAQMTVERNRRIEEVRKNGKRVGEQEALINREYQNRISEARLNFYQKMLQEEQKFYSSQAKLQKSAFDKAYSWEKSAYNRRLEVAIDYLYRYPQMFGVTLAEVDKKLEEFQNGATQSMEEFMHNLDELNRGYLVDEIGLLSQGYRMAEKTIKNGVDDMYQVMQKGEKEEIIFAQSITERLDNDIATRLRKRKEYYTEILRLQKENADKQLELQKDQLETSLEVDKNAEEERFRKQVGFYEKKVLRFDESGHQSSAATKNPILAAYEEYMKGMDTMRFDGMTKQQIGEELWPAMEEVEEFINELESSFQEGLISFEEYNNTMQSELLQTFIKTKNEYENYLEQWNNMSRTEREANLGQLNKYNGLYYEGFTKFLEQLENAQTTHNNIIRTLDNENAEALRQANLQHQQQIQSNTNEYFSNLVNEYDRGYSAIEKLIGTYQTSNRISPEYGFINLKQLNENLDMAAENIKDRLDELADYRKELYNKKQAGEITEEDFTTQLENIDNLSYNLQEALGNIKEKSKEAVQNLVNTLNNYVQLIGQSFQTIMQSFNDLQDYEWEKEQAQLDKQTEELEKKYQEQEKLAEEHKSNIESIEDELSNARGDRRQQLIDSLNAEMAAQRRALAEQKRVEKEQQRLEEEKERLDKKRKEAEYKRNLQSILVSGAMAAANGLATQPFVPVGIAMGALAASLAAVQYALAKQQKPYGDGGVIVGRSHKEGGVPVLGGQASVEGGEFITNKVTTAKNVDLLEYINSKRRKVDIADLLEFYNSGRPSKSIASVRTRFADGGVIPQLRTDISFNDRLITAFEDYSNRPQYVQVVDIIDQTERLNEVKVISGLEV